MGLFFVIGIIAIAGFVYWNNSRPQIQVIPYSSFQAYLERNEVNAVKIINNNIIEGTIQNGGGRFRTLIPYNDPTLLPALEEKKVNISGQISGGGFWGLVREWLPWIIFIILFVVFNRQAQLPQSRAMQFTKNKAKRFQNDAEKVTFEDVAGQKDAKYELEEVVSFLKDPEKYQKMGAKIPKGVLLVGMPGTGKTLMARAVAGEADVPFFHMSGSDFVELFVGVGASRVRDLFTEARKNAPCIIFIDELDAVGRSRGAGLGGGHDEREQTLNQLLVEMDGFDQKETVIMLAATNRPDVLDPALLRPGRFDRQVTIAMPDIKEREAIFKIHLEKIPLADEIDVEKLARATPGMSGAQIANMINEAALYAARYNHEKVSETDFDEARDKVIMGVARKTLVISSKERRMTAYHEAGHALLHYYLKHADPLHKVTIVPHGQALGMAMSLPEEDSYSRTRGWIEDRIAICYGGWAAEKLFFDETTTGTKADLEQASEMARRMVCEWGMAEGIGPVSYGEDEAPIFLGREIARHKNYSEDTAQKIDKAVIDILESSRKHAETILHEHKTGLEKLAEALLEKETMTDAEVRELLGI
ncbi:MAG: ATP-dependent zinc metalloprotease FtsH [Spirochaetaceae bacterium]|nr:ATP-dependent zinc metalloprotease FtsH [Spirochaetaceae bacterium]